MHCHYFDAGLCRSCSLLETPYTAQLAQKQAQARELLSPFGDIEWLEPVASAEENFRNKAKIVVGGTVEHPTLGIIDREGQGIDLQGCTLYEPAISQALPVLEELVRAASLTPYSVPRRKGELKNILLTASAHGELMIRFVLRSKKLLVPIRNRMGWLQEQLPQLAVVSINLLREHVALVEGDEEIILSDQTTLPMQVNDLTLHLRPQSFFQTNTAIAEALYRQGQQWVQDANPSSLWDLYCGVGGFALHTAQVLDGAAQVTGIEVSKEAIASAHRTVNEYGLSNIDFLAGDATEFALSSGQIPELLVVNPPRRGIGKKLAEWVEKSGIEKVIYSSCNAQSLAKDLANMPSLRPVTARVFDMFPHTSHFETIVLLERA
ncbi:MAG: 23S rRNA (uracil(747)-C(5))-methyltransferase RlmC [Rothia sp. (in: high G+C Gram-positive bacteria)]|nr:23S rRNA (uracil(747)-C(5))-methyltransferase RlmC [Rothia sp. (in: high G+C Gram-positive bacteria)]